jgi:surface polysaccharide O-acyltransferase-like enzyme
MYKLFLIITGPVVKAMRKVTPRQVIDKHIPYIAFAVLFWLWIALAWLKRLYCDTHMLQCF